jgi:hypothetical protein
MITDLLQKVITILHISLIVLFIIGPFLPGKYLIYYLFLWPATYIHWYFNDNKCMLTELESHFDQKYVNLNNDEEVYHYKYINILEMLKKINIYFDGADSFTSYLYNIFFICWIVGFIRFLNYYKKDIFNAWSVIKKPLQRRFLTDK